MPETIVDLEQPELDIEPIVADPIEVVIPPPTIPKDEEGGGGGGAEEGGGTTGGSAGGGTTDPSDGIAIEGDPDPIEEDLVVTTDPTEWDENIHDDILQRQIYDMAAKETDPVLREKLEAEYERVGGKHVDDLKAGKTVEEVYDNYPTDPVPEETEETYAEDVFATKYPDGFLGGTFSDIDYNNDGVVSATEQNRWEHEAGQESEDEDPVFGGSVGTGGGTAPIGTDPVVGIGTDPVVGIGTDPDSTGNGYS